MKLLLAAPPQRLQRWFWLLLAVNALYITGSALYLRPLTSGEIIQFELAREVPVATSILHHWEISGKLDKALHSIYLDFLFIILYTGGLAVASLLAARLTRHDILFNTGKFFAYLLIVAGICDVIENLALLKVMNGFVSHFNIVLAYDMAATKFSIIILTLLFLAVCLVFWGLDKITVGKRIL